MDKEDIETIAQLCGLKTETQKIVLQTLLKDAGITDLNADPININLDRLPKEKYAERPAITGKVFYQLKQQGIIGDVSDKHGIIPENKILFHVTAYFREADRDDARE